MKHYGRMQWLIGYATGASLVSIFAIGIDYPFIAGLLLGLVFLFMFLSIMFEKQEEKKQ